MLHYLKKQIEAKKAHLLSFYSELPDIEAASKGNECTTHSLMVRCWSNPLNWTVCMEHVMMEVNNMKKGLATIEQQVKLAQPQQAAQDDDRYHTVMSVSFIIWWRNCERRRENRSGSGSGSGSGGAWMMDLDMIVPFPWLFQVLLGSCEGPGGTAELHCGGGPESLERAGHVLRRWPGQDASSAVLLLFASLCHAIQCHLFTAEAEEQAEAHQHPSCADQKAAEQEGAAARDTIKRDEPFSRFEEGLSNQWQSQLQQLEPKRRRRRRRMLNNNDDDYALQWDNWTVISIFEWYNILWKNKHVWLVREAKPHIFFCICKSQMHTTQHTQTLLTHH